MEVKEYIEMTYKELDELDRGKTVFISSISPVNISRFFTE